MITRHIGESVNSFNCGLSCYDYRFHVHFSNPFCIVNN